VHQDVIVAAQDNGGLIIRRTVTAVTNCLSQVAAIGFQLTIVIVFWQCKVWQTIDV
jgi:hypothetical protein